MSNPFLRIFWAGLCGTMGMTIFLYLLRARKLAHGDALRAVGALVMRSEDHAFSAGMIVHYCFGIFFAFVYSVLVGAFPNTSLMGIILLCGFFGFCHGMVMCLLMTYEIAIEHPLKRFQKMGVQVAVANWIAHIIYGIIVGSILGTISSSSLYIPRF